MGSRRHETPKYAMASTCVDAHFRFSHLPPLRPRRTQLHEGYWPPEAAAWRQMPANPLPSVSSSTTGAVHALSQSVGIFAPS